MIAPVTIPLWWPHTPLPGNLGDVLTPAIFTGLNIAFAPADQNQNGKWLGIGSIVRFALEGDTVWGSGIMRQSDEVCTKARYLAVRGPLTGAKTGCKVYGDPALLASRLFPRSANTQGPAVVPHYRDIDQVPSRIETISPLTAEPHLTCAEISSRSQIASSSLHGIIIAHAYGVPAGWWKPTDRLNGDGSKFEDYARSVGIELTPESDYKRVRYVLPKENRIQAIQDALMEVLSL